MSRIVAYVVDRPKKIVVVWSRDGRNYPEISDTPPIDGVDWMNGSAKEFNTDQEVSDYIGALGDVVELTSMPFTPGVKEWFA